MTNAINQTNAAAEDLFLAYDKIDPTEVAERLLCKNPPRDKQAPGFVPDSYKSFDDKQNTALLGIHMLYSQQKQRVLEAAGDTTFSMEIVDYVAVIEAMGFERVYTETMNVYSKYDQSEREETFFLYAHRDLGIVLQFDSYGPRVNGGEWHACWSKNPSSEHQYGLTASGCYESPSEPDWRKDEKYFESGRPNDLVWVGHWDCREGVKSRINALIKAGAFHAPWPKLRKEPFGLFGSHYDYYTKEYADADRGGFSQYKVSDRYRVERKARLAADPATRWVLEMVGSL